MADTGILPTDRAVARELSEASPDRALEATGGGISVDRTHVTIEKPGDRNSNSEAYSSKARATTCKIMAGCAGDGMILFRGPAVEGRGGEIEYLREHVPSAGHVTASLTDPGTPPAMRISVNFDDGPQGAKEVLRGADVRTPHRKPRNGQLTRDQMDYNARLAGQRATIENNFADIRAHRILGNVFRGSVAELEAMFSVVTGIVNLKQIMRRRRRAPDTHRKKLKPGPKTRGRRAASRAACSARERKKRTRRKKTARRKDKPESIASALRCKKCPF